MKLDKVVIENHGERPFRVTTYAVYIVFMQFRHPRGGQPKVFGAYASREAAEKAKETHEWTPDKGPRSDYANVYVAQIELEDTAVIEPI